MKTANPGFRRRASPSRTAQHFEEERRENSPGTLGDVLYAGRSKSPESEKDWVALIRSIAAGDQLALHALYERTHRIDGRKLHPGDYNRAEPGTGDKRVWSETGCTCVLITSTRDVLR